MAERDRKGRKQTKKSYERRLSSVTASAAALYALPSVVSAAIVHVSGAPVSLSATGPAGAGAFDLSVGWNVDGDANVDFELRKTGTVVTDGPTLRDASGYMFLNSAGLNGNGVVQVFGTADTRAIRRLLPGEVVGPTLGGSYQFGSPGQTNRLMLSFNSSTNGAYMQHGVNVAGQALNGGFVADQLQYFGFSFTSGADTFYGWAAILHDTLGSTGASKSSNGLTTIPPTPRSKSQPYRYPRTDSRC